MLFCCHILNCLMCLTLGYVVFDRYLNWVQLRSPGPLLYTSLGSNKKKKTMAMMQGQTQAVQPGRCRSPLLGHKC